MTQPLLDEGEDVTAMFSVPSVKDGDDVTAMFSVPSVKDGDDVTAMFSVPSAEDGEDVTSQFNASAAPPAKPDTSFSSAIMQGIDAPLEAIGITAQVLGAQTIGKAIRGMTEAPVNYESASEQFSNPKEGDFTVPSPFGDFAPAQIPRAITEQFGQLTGSLISRVAGGIIGGAIGGGGGTAAGSVTGPGAAVTGGIGLGTGAVVGQFAGPFLFGALQIIGPTALERAKRNGRTDPNGEDIAASLVTAAGSGSLDALGAQYLPGGKKLVGSFVKRLAGAFYGESVTEAMQSVAEQTGESLGTKEGLKISLKQAFGEGMIGGISGSGATLISEPFRPADTTLVKTAPSTAAAVARTQPVTVTVPEVAPQTTPKRERTSAEIAYDEMAGISGTLPSGSLGPPDPIVAEAEAAGAPQTAAALNQTMPPKPFAPRIEEPGTPTPYGRETDVYDITTGLQRKPASVAPAAPEGDSAWLEALMNPEASAGQAPQTSPSFKPLKPIIDTLRYDLEKQAKDWDSRRYKPNKTQIELRGDGPGKRDSISIGSINEGRRQKALDAIGGQIRAIDKLSDAISTPEGETALDSAIKRTWDEAGKTFQNSRFKNQGDLFESLLIEYVLKLKPARGAYDSLPLSKAIRARMESEAKPVAASAAPVPAPVAKAMTRSEINERIAVLLKAPAKAGGKPRVSFNTQAEEASFRRGFEAANKKPGEPPPEQRPGVPAKEQKIYDAFSQGWSQAQIAIRSLSQPTIAPAPAAQAPAAPAAPETAPVAPTVTPDASGGIFGYSWDQIRGKQQGGTLAQTLRGAAVKPKATDADFKLLEQHGAEWLYDNEKFGVIDRLGLPMKKPEQAQQTEPAAAPARIQLRSGPATYSVVEQLAPQKGDQPGETYFRVKNEQTGEEQTVEAADMKPVKAKVGAAPVTQPAPVALPTKPTSPQTKAAVAKVAAKLKTTGKTKPSDAKAIKAELVAQIESLLAKATSQESSEAKRIRQELAEAIERKSTKRFIETLQAQLANEVNTRERVIIRSPKAGTFSITTQNDAVSLQDILDRIRGMEVDPKPYPQPKGPSGGGSTEAKLQAEQLVDLIGTEEAIAEMLRQKAQVKGVAAQKMFNDTISEIQKLPKNEGKAVGMKRKLRGSESGAIPASLFADIADFGARIYRDGMNFARWSADMVRHLGGRVRSALKELWVGILNPKGARNLRGEVIQKRDQGGAIGAAGGRAEPKPGAKVEGGREGEYYTRVAERDKGTLSDNAWNVVRNRTTLPDSFKEDVDFAAEMLADDGDLAKSLRRTKSMAGGITEFFSNLTDRRKAALLFLIAQNAATQRETATDPKQIAALKDVEAEAIADFSDLMSQGGKLLNIAGQLYAAMPMSPDAQVMAAEKLLARMTGGRAAEVEAAQAKDTLKTALDEQLKGMDESIRDIMRTKPKSSWDEIRQRIADEVVAKMNLATEAERKAATDKIIADLKKRMEKVRKELLAKMSKPGKPGNKTALDKLWKLWELGALDDDALTKVFMEKAGVKEFTPAFRDKLKKMYEGAETAPEGMPRERILGNIAVELALANPKTFGFWWNLAMSISYGNILGAFTTIFVNNPLGSLATSLEMVAMGSLSNKGARAETFKGAVKTWARSLGDGVAMMRDLWSTGENLQKISQFDSALVNSPVELLAKMAEDPSYPKAFRAAAKAVSQYKWIMRSMMAADAVIRWPAREALRFTQSAAIAKDTRRPGQSLEDAVDELNYPGGRPAAVREARAQAAKERKDGTLKTKLDERLRVIQLLQSKLSAEGTEAATESDELANYGSLLNDQPQDFIGVIASAILKIAFPSNTKSDLQKALGGAAQPFVRFVRTSANATRVMLDYAVGYGAFRYMTRNRPVIGAESLAGGVNLIQPGGREKMSKEAAIRAGDRLTQVRIQRAYLGIALYAGLAAIYAAIDDDDEDPYIDFIGSGPTTPDERRRVRESGVRLNSIKIGDTYVPTNVGPLQPLAGVFAPFQRMRDNKKYPKAKDEFDNKVPELAGVAVAKGIGDAIMNQSFTRSLADLLTILNTGKTSFGEKPVEFFGKNLAQFIPGNLRGLSQLDEIVSGKKERADGFFDTAANSIAFYAPNGRATTILGDEVDAGKSVAQKAGEKVFQFTTLADDKTLQFVTKNGLSVPDRQRKIDGKRQTYPEYSAYMRESGKMMRNWLETKNSKTGKTGMEMLQSIPEEVPGEKGKPINLRKKEMNKLWSEFRQVALLKQ